MRAAVAERGVALLRWLPPWWVVRIYHKTMQILRIRGPFASHSITCRVEPHGFAMDLKLDDWMERLAAVTGLYYEIEATATLVALLKPGDVFVDVGANIGFMALTAAKIVGSSGRVIAFEPNEDVLDRFRDTVARNEITNVEFHGCALGDVDGAAQLTVNTHHGASSLRHGKGREVTVKRGDEVVANLDPDCWCLIKIDVEGYEEVVLRGLEALLARPRTSVLAEITDGWLRMVGGSAGELFAFMNRFEYLPFRPSVTPWSTLRFERLSGPLAAESQYDVLFIRNDEESRARIGPWARIGPYIRL